MSVLQLGAQLLGEQLGGGTDNDQLNNALSGLLGGDGGDLDLGGLISGMSGEGMADLVGSWLGDGDNSPISVEQISAFFDNSRIEQFANTLGIDLDVALSSLTEVLPRLIDQSSSGGNLLDSVGGIDGVMDLAKKLF